VQRGGQGGWAEERKPRLAWLCSSQLSLQNASLQGILRKRREGCR